MKSGTNLGGSAGGAYLLLPIYLPATACLPYLLLPIYLHATACLPTCYCLTTLPATACLPTCYCLSTYLLLPCFPFLPGNSAAPSLCRGMRSPLLLPLLSAVACSPPLLLPPRAFHLSCCLPLASCVTCVPPLAPGHPPASGVCGPTSLLPLCAATTSPMALSTLPSPCGVPNTSSPQACCSSAFWRWGAGGRGGEGG